MIVNRPTVLLVALLFAGSVSASSLPETPKKASTAAKSADRTSASKQQSPVAEKKVLSNASAAAGLSQEPASGTDSPLVRAAKKAQASRNENAKAGRVAAPMNEWMARGLGTLASVSTQPPRELKRTPPPTSSQPNQGIPRPVAQIRRDAARAAEELLEVTPNEEEDEDAVARRLQILEHEMERARQQQPAPATP